MNVQKFIQKYFKIGPPIFWNWLLYSYEMEIVTNSQQWFKFVFSCYNLFNGKIELQKECIEGRRILIKRSNGRQNSEMESWPKNQTQLQFQPIECECVLRSRLLLLICFLVHHTDHSFCLWIIERLIFLFKIIRKLLSGSLFPSLYRHLPKDACLFNNLSGKCIYINVFFVLFTFFLHRRNSIEY